MAVTNELVMTLRKITNAGIMDCKNALLESKGDMDKAKTVLREKGILKMASREGMLSNEGQVGSYIHPGGKIGVLVEIACETDFVAKSDDFQKILKETAIQCAGMKADYVRKEEVPADVVENEKKILRAQSDLSKKPPQIAEKIIEGKLSKFYESSVLLEQPYFRDEKKKFADFFNESCTSFGEAVKITRFVRFEIGQ